MGTTEIGKAIRVYRECTSIALRGLPSDPSIPFPPSLLISSLRLPFSLSLAPSALPSLRDPPSRLTANVLLVASRRPLRFFLPSAPALHSRIRTAGYRCSLFPRRPLFISLSLSRLFRFFTDL